MVQAFSIGAFSVFEKLTQPLPISRAATVITTASVARFFVSMGEV
jgi:hypothetical protein